MKELILLAGRTLHLIAAVTWIGGIIFILFIAIPSSKQVLGANSGQLMAAVSKRFTPWANYSILFLVTTGVVLSLEFRNWTALIPKLTVVTAMVAVHFYRGLALAPKIAAAQSETEKTALQKLSLNLVKINLALGIFVLFLSVGLSA